MIYQTIEAAKQAVRTDPGIIAVYQFDNAFTKKTQYVVEHKETEGTTAAAGVVRNLRVLYTREGGWTQDVTGLPPSPQVCGGPGGPISSEQA